MPLLLIILTKEKFKILFQILKVLKVIFHTKLRMAEFIQIMLGMLQLLMAIPWLMKLHINKFPEN